jgi:hypothetical protein
MFFNFVVIISRGSYNEHLIQVIFKIINASIILLSTPSCDKDL